MTTLKTKLALVAASTLALASISRADTPAAITLGGFIVSDWTHISGATEDHLNVSSALLSATGVYGAVTGVVSLYTDPGIFATAGSTTPFLLDANATWNLGSGWSVQGGRFLSWMGYESFFTVNNPEITGANSNPAFISGYEDGVRAVYKQDTWNMGVAIVDSAFSATAFQGDGELKNSFGAEVYIDFTPSKDLNVWFGVAHDSSNRTDATATQRTKGITTFDLYAQYQVMSDLYVAGEYTVEDNVLAEDSETWLVLADYTFSGISKQLSAAFRVSGDIYNGVTGAGHNDFRYTFAPTYMVNDHFSVRAEITYQVDNATGTALTNGTNATFLGVQAIFKF